MTGTGDLYYYWSAEGIPASGGLPESDQGIRVRRRFLSREAKPMDLNAIAHGDVMIAEIAVQSERTVDNVVISDLLPGGLEIENPRIATRDTLPDLGEMEDSPGVLLVPDRVEMRDDRLLLFADLIGGRQYVYRYAVRAVTRGQFRLPPIQASCMYNPAVCSVHGAGAVRIVHER